MAEILQQTDSIIDFDILINGKKIKDTVKVQEISIDMEVNRITSATIIVQDGGAIGVVDQPFTNSEGADFIPGTEIEISLGNIDKTEKVFKGIIVSQRLKVKGDKSQLTVKCKDKAVSMSKGRYNAIFQNKKDSDAIKDIISKYGLDFEMDATSQEHPVLMQYNCSDWDYLLNRAEANNMLVNTYQNKLYIIKNDFNGPAKFEIKSSQIVIDIDLSLESENIPTEYNMASWNPDTQEIVSTSLRVNDSLGQGNLSATELSENLSKSSHIYSSNFIEKEEMKTWLESRADAAVLQKIQGKITIPGSNRIIAGDIIILSEFSTRFNGKAFISKVTHSLQNGVWVTELTVGKSAKSHASFPDVEDMGASGLIPALKGTQIAIVKQIIEDPNNNYRVLVTLPAFTGTGQEEGIWARMAFPYASADAGFFFFPEIDDEVLVHFINNDPRFPVITGSLYSTKNKPKETPDDKNQFKAIHSKSGISIRFDDDEKVLVFETPDGNSCTLNDKEKSITLKDLSGNSITLNDGGILIDSIKDVKLGAQGDVQISATGSIDLKANGDVKSDGTNIQFNAKSGFTAKGNASAEISASGQTTVKGAMVMIN
ncbi:type VI secretion system tip protein VgrG [Maribacter algicola]|uniref:Type VI secretion system tip protein VgrG n=1 Tax=Maribacter algicola TaxID=2498892 RepID=A0A3R8Q2D9_9FLAO|nr:type VI secretion system tip protein VgrG [Maribacter algicola]RRQ48393.1 type VI secretion system tip protein VgrG [Maribacter algicola]